LAYLPKTGDDYSFRKTRPGIITPLMMWCYYDICNNKICLTYLSHIITELLRNVSFNHYRQFQCRRHNPRYD